VKNAIIFCNRKRDVAILLKSLQKHGFNAGALHGDMDQMSRMATLDAFREGRITLLAASDVAARGLDIPDVSHIFNFDVPWQSDDYVHRIGRTGRAGKEGRSLTLVTPDDIKQLKDIEKMLGAAVTWIGEPPSADDIANGSRRRGRGRRGAARPGPSRQDARGSGRPDRNAPRRHREHANGSAANGRHAEPAPQPARPAESQSRAEGQERRSQPVERPQRSADRPRQAKEPRPAKQQRQPWEPRPPRQPRRETKDGAPTPVGLGDHIPAFLRKPARTAQ
jgi:superfamily II DNA/RNA helicase